MQHVAGSVCASKQVRYRSVFMCRNRVGGGEGMDSPYLVPSDRDYRKAACEYTCKLQSVKPK
jgi:hypothetical protein